MSVRVVSSEAEFESLKEPWQRLSAANVNHTPFQSWEWNFAWWKHFGTPGDLYLVLVEQDGNLLGIAPFYINSRYEGVPLRHLAFLSRKRADYLDFLVVPGAEVDFFAELFEFLGSPASGLGFIELRDFPAGSINLPHLLRCASGPYPSVLIRRAENCATLSLPATWEEYLATLGKNLRRNVGRYRRQLEDKFTLGWKAPTSTEDVRQCFDDFAAVYRSRWSDEHGATLFDEPRSAAFEREVCELASVTGWFRFYLLYLDEKPVAGYLGYVWNNKFYAGLLAHVPEYHKLSAGSVLIAMSIEDCIRNGLTEFDMTRGAEGYKTQWNCRPKYNYIIKLSRTHRLNACTAGVDWLRRRLGQSRTLLRARAIIRQRKFGASRAEDAQPERSLND